MSVNSKVIGALKEFGCPCKPDIYTGSETRYFTFNAADERGQNFGDNRPGCVVLYMQIHFFCPWKEDGKEVNYLTEKKKIREALFKAGFTFPEVTALLDKEKNVRHIIFECEIEEE